MAVTGASGFIGRHLVDRLVSAGASVVALSRHGTGRADVDDRPTDYTDDAALRRSLEGIDVVVHLAARAHELGEVDNSPEAEGVYRMANVESTIALAKAARLSNVCRFIFMSSIGVNGNATCGKPFSVSDEPHPIEPYAKSKWLAEQAVARTLATGPTDFVILRPPLVYGHDCRGNFARLLHLAARAPVLPLGAVTAPRTLIGIDNLVSAIVTAASSSAVSRRTFLVTDSRDTNLSEIMRALARGCGRPTYLVVAIPSNLLAFTAKLAGKTATWDKLAASLQVDGSEFCRVTGWRAAIDPDNGLFDAARQFAIGRKLPNPQ